MDLIHKQPAYSIYFRTDYLVRSDMTIPLALASHSIIFGYDTELGRRPGIVEQDRAPQYTPLVLHPAILPRRGK